jgi:hypothetical protein
LGTGTSLREPQAWELVEEPSPLAARLDRRLNRLRMPHAVTRTIASTTIAQRHECLLVALRALHPQ